MKNTQSKNQETLLDFLERVPSHRTCIVNNQKSVTYSEILAISNIFLDKYSVYKNSNIAVKFDSRDLAVKFLPSISYLANNLLILPNGLEAVTEQNFFLKSDMNYYFNFSESDVEVKKISQHQSANSKRRWILATSGTTGTPKLVSYELERLTGTAKTDVEKGDEYNWALVYDINRFAGLQVYFQAIRSGSKLTILESNYSVSEIIDLLISTNVNCLSATPSFYRKLLMDPRSHHINFKRITLGGEIADQTILNTLKTTYHEAKITHIYASTEAGVGFSVNDMREGFPVSFLAESSCGSNFRPNLKLKDGALWIKSKNSSNTIISGVLQIDDEGYINTGDLVSIVEDRVIFMGRESGTINVGGNKALPEEIERIILKHDAVSECHVFGKKNSMMGMLVACNIVLKEPCHDHSQLKKDILSFCYSQLEPFKVPALIKFVEQIEKNSVGKIMRGKAL
ncbi:AMP-binding enzyme [Vibrio cholerae]|uniref:AMP-binding enzyme n=1 Tax=Vibrio cholerae TaxID=666 RepID=UPI00115A2D2E|nr:class I adenylate-forming enzyme family protein [Vibrio cholerae]TQQ53784.1 acyl--CoA ligase [Vibrio cholerae]